MSFGSPPCKEIGVEKCQVKNIGQLIDVIGAGCDPFSNGPVVVEATLWDGRVVRASYYRGPYENANIETKLCVVVNDNMLRSFVEKLLSSGESFRVLTGESDDTCFLEWTIDGADEITEEDVLIELNEKGQWRD